MNLDLLHATQFDNFGVDKPRGLNNSGGGMSVYINAIEQALMSRYHVNRCTELEHLSAPLCLVETCFLVSNIIDADYIGAVTKKIDAFNERTKGVKTWLICAELTLLRMLPEQRERLLEGIDILTVTDPYLWHLLRTVDVVPHGYLCDSINSELFRPIEKTMTVTGVGALKHGKNIDWTLEVYKQLEGKMERKYFGSAALWSGEERKEDLELIDKIQEVTEYYAPNANMIDVAYHNASAAFAVNNTWHDCSCRANEELLMSGVISIHGLHPLFRPRPGFTVSEPEEAVQTLAVLTDNFTKMPDPQLHENSRNWALQNVSEDVFLKQFETLLKRVL